MAAAIYAFGVALRDPAACCLAYFASFVCDELDGRFARKFNQCSTLGSGGRRAHEQPLVFDCRRHSACCTQVCSHRLPACHRNMHASWQVLLMQRGLMPWCP